VTNFPSVLPTAETTALQGGARLKWGIIAPGDIAKDFVHAVHTHTDQTIVAVASRSSERASEFARIHGIESAYGDYRELLEDRQVDIVYVASPHSEHKRFALAAIAAGKHVLIEKPIGVTAAEATEIRDAARQAGVFVTEGLWTRYLPQVDVMMKLIADGVLGEVRLVSAEFSTRAPVDLAGRNYNPELAGGALLDLGIYPVWFSHLFLGKPTRVNAFGSLTSTGVDAQTSITLEYASGAQSVLSSSLLFFSPGRASVSGSDARIEVNPWFVVPAGFELLPPQRSEPGLTFSNDSEIQFRDGIAWEVAAIASYVSDGLLESPLHPLQLSIDVMETMDSVRRSVGTLIG
jgi:predicted dehydrogenase